MPNKEPATEGAMADVTSLRETHQDNRDPSQEREARDAAIARQVAETVAREMAKGDGKGKCTIPSQDE